MITNLGKESIVSYLTTDESAVLKQLTLIYPTAEALEKDKTMPKMFPLIVFTKHRSRIQRIKDPTVLEWFLFRRNSIFSMHPVLVTYYMPNKSPPRLLDSLLIKNLENKNSFYGMIRE